jgi:predicted nucleic acid-binding protein
VPSVVSNTGPLIALATIGQFDLLHKLFGEILIPPAVRAEILDENTVNAVTAADWIMVSPAQDEIAVQLLRGELDAGESEAIVLARELNADLLLLDDRSARRKAGSIELSTIGTLGVLLLAKNEKLIPVLGPLVDDLRRAGFHMSDELYDQVLDSAGEKD